MKALTIWQPWASLIIAGAKPYEFRSWTPPASIIGQRIAIHAGAREMKLHEVRDLLIKLSDGRCAETGLVRDMARPILLKVKDALDRRPHDYKGVKCQVCGEEYSPRRGATFCRRPGAMSLPTSSILGTGVLGPPTLNPVVDGKHLVEDSDRTDHLNYGWPLTDIQPIEPPIPARGAQGFWEWNDA